MVFWRIVKQYERMVVLRWGKFMNVRGPGLRLVRKETLWFSMENSQAVRANGKKGDIMVFWRSSSTSEWWC